MDVPENNIQETAESNCQVPFLENNSKLDSTNQDFNENQTTTTIEHSDTLFNIPLQTQEEFGTQLIINDEVVAFHQDNESSNSYMEQKDAANIVQGNSNEFEVISLQNTEQMIVTTLSEAINCENDTMITTACVLQSAVKDLILDESCNTREESDRDALSKVQESSINSADSVINESLPSFIGEIDESVSIPPAEPLILEETKNLHEIIEEMDKESLSCKTNITENITQNEIATKAIGADNVLGSISENEIVTQKNEGDKNCEKTVTISEISTDNAITSMNEQITDTENIPSNSVSDTLNVNEIELTEASSSEIVTTTASNIQYTVLPPGENSLYQEDGTLVVEYPLHATTMVPSEPTNLNELIATNKITIAESTEPRDHEIAEEKEKSVKREANIIEMVEAASEDENLSIEEEIPVQQQEKPQPKRRGRKAAEGIPPHIVGFPIDKQETMNGKPMKSRLGVKIPYRKLASQIVSTSELQNHIVERARMKVEARFETEKSNIFTKKLTHRLAQSLSGLTKKDLSAKEAVKTNYNKTPEENIKIIENIVTAVSTTSSGTLSEEQPTNPIEFVEQIVNEETGVLENVNADSVEVALAPSESIKNEVITETAKSAKIGSNSDLIAILEGDGEESASEISVQNVVEIVDTSESASEIKEIEKEISLTDQNTSNTLTPLVKEKKFFKSRESRVSEVSKEKTKEGLPKVKPSLRISSSITKILSAPHVETRKDNIFNVDNASVSKNDTKTADLKRVSGGTKPSEKGKSTGTVIEVEPQLKPAMVLKTYTRKRKSNDVATPEPVKKAFIVPSPSSQPDPKIDCITPVPPNVYITKSSRVIKKKVIWDPDEAMPSVRSQSKILNKIETAVKTTPLTKVTTHKQTPAKPVEKKVSDKEKQSDQTKITKVVDIKVVKSNQDEKEKKIVVDKPTLKKPEKVEVVKKIISKSPVTDKTQQKVVITSSMKISPGKSPKRSFKRLSEIDKLLMDEGAVNMLYDINNSDDQKRRVSGRSGTTPTDKAQTQKELLNRTLEIKNELTQGTNVDSSTPKTLRKKEMPPSAKKDTEIKEPPTIISRKMSKDSAKSSTHSPPPSPAAFSAAEASRIIRRHSSSSFSSNDGVSHEESTELTSEKDNDKQSRRKETERPTITEENVSPQTEQNKERTTKKRVFPTPDSTPKKKAKKDESMVANGQQSKPTEIVVKSEPGIVTGALKTDPTKAFTVIKMNKHYMINLSYSGGESYLSAQLLKDLTVTIKELERTRNCSVVSINSQGPAFCLGINYNELLDEDEELRNKKIVEMTNAIRDFLKCLLNFSKIIVAGVKGDCIGLGVTMLPLFDMIVATDTASFCTPYSKVGCPPEAGFLLSIPYQSNHGLASELLYTAQRMNADEAQRRGLVTKLFWPEKFDAEFRTLLSHISNLSKPALMVTKKQLRQSQQKIAETEISNNCKLLIKYWNTSECQKDFENYNALTFDMI